MSLWLLAFWALGYFALPNSLDLLGLERGDLSARGQVNLNDLTKPEARVLSCKTLQLSMTLSCTLHSACSPLSAGMLPKFALARQAAACDYAMELNAPVADFSNLDAIYQASCVPDVGWNALRNIGSVATSLHM